MTIAEKLEKIADNVEKVYNSGVETGKAQGGGGVNPLDYATNMPSFASADFANCPDFVVKVPNFSGTSINSMFANTKNLQSVTLICDIRNKPITANQAFYNSKQLKTIDLSNFNTTFSTMAHTFYGCSALEEIAGTLDFSNTTNVSGIFGLCSSLKEVRIAPNCTKVTFDMPSSAKELSKDSITSIINGLSDTTSGLTLSLSKTAVDNAEFGNKDNVFYYPYAETTKTDNGITFTDNGDGSITLNGTATAETTFTISNNVYMLDGLMYHIGGVPTDVIFGSVVLEVNSTVFVDFGGGWTGVSSVAGEHNLAIKVSSGAELNNVVIKPELYITGTGAMEWDALVISKPNWTINLA